MDVAALADPKRINHALFGVYYEEDVFERFCDFVPGALRGFAGRIPAAMLARKLIFIHVPRVAGTSITRALYGPFATRHHSIRYYRAVNPDFCLEAESFALLRDPFDRFASAYAFVRAGGTATCRLSAVFAAATAGLRCVDDYLSFLEGRAVLAQDFVMRPQSWFVCDLKTGVPLVDRLFLYGEDGLGTYLRQKGVGHLPWLNGTSRLPLFLSAKQKRRIEQLYAGDFALIAAVRARYAQEAEAAAFGIAAE